MLYLGFRDAIFKGEKVKVVAYKGESDKRRKTDWVSYIDSQGGEHEMVKGLNPYWDFDEYDKSEKLMLERAVEAHLSLFAGMAMQAFLKIREDFESPEQFSSMCVSIAQNLCLELGKVDIESFSKECHNCK